MGFAVAADLDECRTEPCDENAICANKAGTCAPRASKNHSCRVERRLKKFETVFLYLKRRLKRRNAWLWRFEQRFKLRNASGFGVFDIYAKNAAIQMAPTHRSSILTTPLDQKLWMRSACDSERALP